MIKNPRFSLLVFLTAAVSAWAMEDANSCQPADQGEFHFEAVTHYVLKTINTISFCFIREDKIYLAECANPDSGDYPAPCTVYDAETGQKLGSYSEVPLINLTFSRTAPIAVFVSHKGQMFVYDATNPEQAPTTQLCEGDYRNIDDLYIHPENRWMMATRADDRATSCDGKTGKVIATYDGVKFASFSPNGDFLATTCTELPGNAISLCSTTGDGEPRMIRLSDVGSDIVDDDVGYTAVTFASFSPNNKLLATACYDLNGYVFETATGNRYRKLVGHHGHVDSASFTPDSKRLMTGAKDGTVKMWNLESGQVLFTIFQPDAQLLYTMSQPAHLDSCNIMATISPDGTRLGVIFEQRFLGIYDADTGELLSKIIEKGNVSSLQFVPREEASQDVIRDEAATRLHDSQLLVRFNYNKVGMVFLPTDALNKPCGLKMRLYVTMIKSYLASIGHGASNYEGFLAFFARSGGADLDRAIAIESAVFSTLDECTQGYLNVLIPNRPDFLNPRGPGMRQYVALIKTYLASIGKEKGDHQGFLAFFARTTETDIDRVREHDNTVFRSMDGYSQKHVNDLIPGRYLPNLQLPEAIAENNALYESEDGCEPPTKRRRDQGPDDYEHNGCGETKE